MQFSAEVLNAARALKNLARNEQVKTYIQESPELYPLLLKAAQRYITGESREEGLLKAQQLLSKGYRVSLEFIGENTSNREECARAKDEYVALINEMGQFPQSSTVSFDLSHLGLSINRQLAYDYLCELGKTAKQYNVTLMISMEESAKTDAILDIYKRAVQHYSNIGLTIQAHLYRSVQDIQELLNYPGKIRLVKGAYQESTEVAFGRSEALNQQYLALLTTLIEAKHPVSIATHDEGLIREMITREFLNKKHVEVEMLYGIRADLLKELKNQDVKTGVYLTYGKEWYLYLCHRIAEFPPNVYRALNDITSDSDTEINSY